MFLRSKDQQQETPRKTQETLPNAICQIIFLLLKITINQSIMIKFPVCKTNWAIGKASKSKPTNTKLVKEKKKKHEKDKRKWKKKIQGKKGIKPQKEKQETSVYAKNLQCSMPREIRLRQSTKINKPKSTQELRSKLLFWVLVTWFGLDLSPQVLFGAYILDISTHSLIINVYFVQCLIQLSFMHVVIIWHVLKSVKNKILV